MADLLHDPSRAARSEETGRTRRVATVLGAFAAGAVVMLGALQLSEHGAPVTGRAAEAPPVSPGAHAAATATATGEPRSVAAAAPTVEPAASVAPAPVVEPAPVAAPALVTTDSVVAPLETTPGVDTSEPAPSAAATRTATAPGAGAPQTAKATSAGGGSQPVPDASSSPAPRRKRSRRVTEHEPPTVSFPD